MEILIKALQLILSLSILVVLHELGHFIPAKLFKTRVEKFYLFFDPWFSLFKFKKGGTEYGIGWLPLGGYVKIAGMIDESMDKEQMKLPPQPWEFRAKPAWQRLIIMVGGVTANALLAIVIYSGILYTWGEEYLPTKNLKYGVAVDSTAMKLGIRPGDKILSVDGKPVDNFLKIPGEIVMNQARSIQVDRAGEKVDIAIPSTFIKQLIKTQENFLLPRQPFEIGGFSKTSAAEKAGIKLNDKVVGFNEKKIEYFDEFRSELKYHKGKEVKVTVIRDGQEKVIPVTVPPEGLMGVMPKSIDNYLQLEKVEYSLAESVPAGARKAYSTFGDYIKQLKLIFSPETKAYEHLGGFIMLGKAFSPEWDWVRFWSFTAFLSIMLAIMNILPIPALDGGHVMFLLYEVITRRKPNEKFMEYAQIAGMVFLFSLLIYANGNDIAGLFKN